MGIGTPTRAYLWVKNQTHNIDQYLAYRCGLAKQRLQRSRGEPVEEALPYPPKVVRGAIMTVNGLDWKGRYRVEWWDTYRGRIISRTIAQAKWGGSLTLEVPEVSYDVAAKVIRMGLWERSS